MISLEDFMAGNTETQEPTRTVSNGLISLEDFVKNQPVTVAHVDPATPPNFFKSFGEKVSSYFPDQSALGIARNTIFGLFNPENLPLGVGEAVKQIREEPEISGNLTAHDWLNGIVETGKGVLKYPANVVANLAGVPLKFNIPGLGEVTNRQFNAAQRISNGEDLATVLATEGSGTIFDTLFLVGMGQKAFGGRPATIARGEAPPGITVKEPPKTGRLYEEPIATKSISPEFVQKMATEQGITLGENYNPELPTFFRMTGKANGKVVGEVVQIKPSYFETFMNVLKGDTNKVPTTELIPLISKETSIQAFKDAPTVPIPPEPVAPPIKPITLEEFIGEQKAVTEAPTQPVVIPPELATKVQEFFGTKNIDEFDTAVFDELKKYPEYAASIKDDVKQVIKDAEGVGEGVQIPTTLPPSTGDQIVPPPPSAIVRTFTEKELEIPEKSRYYANNGTTGEWTVVRGKPVSVDPSINTFVYKRGDGKYAVTELTSGHLMAAGATEQEAIDASRAGIEQSATKGTSVQSLISTAIKNYNIKPPYPSYYDEKSKVVVKSKQPLTQQKYETPTLAPSQARTPAEKVEEISTIFTSDNLPELKTTKTGIEQDSAFGRNELKTLLSASKEFESSPVLTVDSDKNLTYSSPPDKDGKISTSFKIKPEALGLNKKKLEVGQKVRVDVAALKAKGAPAQLRVYQDDEVYAFNPKNLEEPSSPAAAKETDKIIKRSDIAKELSEKLGVPIRRGKFTRQAIGIFKPTPKVVRIKSGGLPTIFHEIGHFLDDKFKLSDIIDAKERKALMVEYGHEYANQPNRQRQEAFAEFLRFMMTGQEAKAQELAPNFYEAYQERINGLPEVKEVLDVATDNFRRWQEQPAAAKVLSHISLGEAGKAGLIDSAGNELHRLYTMSIDDLHPISEFSKMAGKIDAERDPYILARNLRGWVGKANVFLTKGTFGKKFWEEVDGKIVPKFKGKSFSEIMEPISKSGRLNDFRVYLVSQRAIELSDRGKVTGISEKDAEAAMKELNERYPDFEQTAKDLYQYEDDLLVFAHENGVVGTNGLERIREANKFRVPFYRVMEETRSSYMGGKKIGGNLATPIKKIKGSEREIIDPIESIIKDTYAIINASERNNIGVAMANLSTTNFEMARLFEQTDKPLKPTTVNVKEVLEKAAPEIADIIPEELAEELVTLFRPTQDRGANMLNVNFGDTSKVFQVDPDLFKALQGLDAEDVGLLWRIMAVPARLLRAGATLSPDFMFRNPVRDQWSATIFSKYGYVPGYDLVRGIFEVLKKGDLYDLWRMGGGEHSMLVSLDRGDLKQKFDDLMASKTQTALNILKHPIDMLRVISELGEQATRLGEMKRALEAHASPIDAAFASREVTLDFARIGSKTKAVNAIVAFFNAGLQGPDRMARAFKDNPWRTSWKLFSFITLPSLLLYFANRDDKRWKEIPQWQKDLFWIVFTEEHIHRIPKPFGLGQIFGSVPERVLEFMDTQNPDMFKELQDNVLSGLTPGFMPTFMLPFMENTANYSFFSERPIVSQGREKLPPEAQYNTFTTETSKIIGERIDYSPAKIDNLIQGYTGGLGKYALSILDKVLVGTGIITEPPPPAKALEDYPVIKAFMIRPPVGSSSESVNRLYSEYNRITGESKYAKELLESGQREKALEFIKSSPYIKYAKMLDSVVGTFSEFNTAIDQIRASKTMTPEQKRAKIYELDSVKTDIASRVLRQIK